MGLKLMKHICIKTGHCLGNLLKGCRVELHRRHLFHQISAKC